MTNKYEYIQFLNEYSIKTKFLLVAYYFKDLGAINYRLVNIVLHYYFGKKIIYSNFYLKYFINSGNFQTEIIDKNKFKFTSFKESDMSKFEYEISLIEGIYNKYSKLSDEKILSIYSKII